jgi:hypothetical protein
MTTRKYISIGNRRDKNLADVENPVTALNNLLNGISGEGTFISEDLDAIRGLQFQKITANNLATIAGSTVFVTSSNTNAIDTPAQPLITLRDKVENARIITATIPAYQGGLGLDARFIASTEINSGNASSTGSDIFDFNSDQVLEPQYWEYGNFSFADQLESSFSDEYGGIQWTGYFSPYILDPNPTIYYETTGLLMVEYDLLESNNWVKVANIYDEEREVTVGANTTGNVVELKPNEYIKLGIGDKLSSNNEITITDLTATSIVLSDNITVSNNQNISFTKELGLDLNRNFFVLPTVEPGNQIKIRISFWYPDYGDEEEIEDKILNFNYIGSTTLPFPYLYDEKPTSPGQQEIRTYLDNVLSPYNNDIGTSGTAGSNYKNLNIAKTYINNYEPKANTVSIVTANSVTLNFTQGSTVASVTGSIANVSVGNYIVPTSPTGNSIPTNLQLKNRFGESNLIILDEPATVTGTRTVNFIENKGFIGWYFGTSSGNTVTLTVGNTSNLQTNNILVSNSTSSIFNRITNIVNSSVIATSNAPSLSGTQLFYVYSEKGITDKSKLVFCAGVFGAVLASNAAMGANSLVVTSNAGIVAGQVVQYSGLIPESPATTVTSVSGNTVNLSNNITSQILQNSTITFAPSDTSTNKEICVLPLDTAPPFVATNRGLSTVNRGIKSTASENFVVETSELILSTNNQNITAAPTTPQYDTKIRINNGQYFIIGKKV